jgi:DNA-binding transcriptional LysR family regulator
LLIDRSQYRPAKFTEQPLNLQNKPAKMQDLNWNDLRFILALARHRTFAGAARQLSVNESTVARRIAHAEQQLGAQLFERSPGALHITEAGARVVSGAEHIELEIQAISGSVSGADRLTAGTVRLPRYRLSSTVF